MKYYLTIFLILCLTSLPTYAFWDDKLFIDIFPVAKVASRNFKPESIDTAFVLDYFDQPRIFTIGTDFHYQGLRLYLALDFLPNLQVDQNNFSYSNFPFGPNGFAGGVNNNWPTTSFLEYKISFFEMSVGRRPWALGYGEYGLAVSGTTPYFDGLWIGLKPKAGDGHVFYYFLMAADDHLAGTNMLSNNAEIWNGANPSHPEDNPYEQYENSAKWFFTHKLGYAGENYRIGIAESSVVYGAPLSFWNVNPFTFWHNTYDNNLNVNLSASGEGTIGPVRLFGEFLLDDVKLGGLDANPTAFGLYLGAEWQVFTNEDSAYQGHRYQRDETLAMREESFKKTTNGLKLTFQVLYTSTYLYGRDEDDPFGKFTMMNSIIYGAGERTVAEYYMGAPYGPDAILIEVVARYEQPKMWIDSRLGILLQGYHNDGGFYSNEFGWEMQGLYDKSEENNDWAFSGVDHVVLIAKIDFYYLITPAIATYVGLNNRLTLDEFELSRAEVATGVAMHF
jgi:hypothetical protein